MNILSWLDSPPTTALGSWLNDWTYFHEPLVAHVFIALQFAFYVLALLAATKYAPQDTEN